MLRIQKTTNNESTEIIEQENQSIELNLKMDQSACNLLAKVIATGRQQRMSGASTYGYNRVGTFINLLSTNVYELLNNSRLFLINSASDVSNGMIEGQTLDASLGVIGACNIDWIGYSGDSSTRGSMNLKESSRDNQLNRFVHHIVIDFPTHAANGSFDTIIFQPQSNYENSLDSNHVHFKSPQFVPRPVKKIGEIAAGNGDCNSAYNYITGFNTGEIIYSHGFYNDSEYKRQIFKEGITYSLPADLDGLKSSYYIYVNFNNRMYLLNLESPYLGMNSRLDRVYLYEVTQLLYTETTATPTIGTGMLLTTVLTDIQKSSMSNDIVIGTIDTWGDITYIAYYNETLNKSYINFYDASLNLIKYDEVPSLAHGYTVFNRAIFKKDEEEILVIDKYMYNHQLDNLGVFSLSAAIWYNTRYFICANQTYALFNKSSPIMAPIKINNSAVDADWNEIFLIEQRKPAIKIKLLEPVNKTNIETLKLIFDFDITIE